VEGYSNWLWMLLLEGLWWVFRLEPPQTANGVALFFGLISMGIAARMFWQLNWRAALARYVVIFSIVFLGMIVSNRTWLTWTSSGLETSLFTCLVLAWMSMAFFSSHDRLRQLGWLSVYSVGLYLTRPEGILFVFCFLAMAAWFLRQEKTVWKKVGWRCLPLAVVPLHLMWRRTFYGEWLPNTYYAKIPGLWPESGMRYFASFLLEYGYWLTLGVLGFWVWKKIRMRENRLPQKKTVMNFFNIFPGARDGFKLFSVCALLGHFAVFTFGVGGDHFEFRIYHHLVPLLGILLFYLINALDLSPKRALLLSLTAWLISVPIPWTHWALSHTLNQRQTTFKMKIAVAPAWPQPFALYAQTFDALQAWLIEHFVCVRHQEHKINLAYLQALFPDQATAKSLASGDYPVFVFPAVGWPGWILPQMNILDAHGLNDYVIARTPPNAGAERNMAHDRQPPPGYLEGFLPNVRLVQGRIEIFPRARPYSAEDIRRQEHAWRARVRGLRN
jgi:arabinofuranosyltransferase